MENLAYRGVISQAYKGILGSTPSTQDNNSTSVSRPTIGSSLYTIPVSPPPTYERTTSVKFSDSDGQEGVGEGLFTSDDETKLAAEMATVGRLYRQGLESRHTRR